MCSNLKTEVNTVDASKNPLLNLCPSRPELLAGTSERGTISRDIDGALWVIRRPEYS